MMNEKSSHIIFWANGDSPDRYPTYEDAVDMLDKLGYVVGHDGDLDSWGDRTLFWRTEADAENDDGLNTAGEIRPV